MEYLCLVVFCKIVLYLALVVAEVHDVSIQIGRAVIIEGAYSDTERTKRKNSTGSSSSSSFLT